MIENPYLLIAACLRLVLQLTIAACSENTTPPPLEAFAYPSGSGHCQAGSRAGAAGSIDGKVSADGIRYMVRTPSNYDATFAHPLLMVYAPAGLSRWGTERFMGLTTAATGAGFVVVYADKDLEGFQCRDPLPVMIMHSKNDKLFPGWGAQTSAWWAKCNGCDAAKTKPVEGGCRAYQGCASGGATLYCEGTGSHRDWPNLNRVMLEFFAHPEKFQ